jgi:ribonucleotide reductase beta subunit family protein with ferritin-like domain
MKTVFNKSKKLDSTKQPMFFGEDLAVQRYDTFKYPVFDRLTQQQLGFFWRPEEVSLQKDRNDYAQLSESQKFIFTSNLKYQTMLDSVQGRGPCLAFLPFVSIPELEGAIVAWDFMETIHSRSYTYIIKNLYSNPSDVFDTIIQDEKIEKRAKSVTEGYDKLIDLGYKYKLDPKSVDEYELKKALWLSLVTVNVLEGLRFYVSFACSFAFGELKLMEGSAKILSLIARDESQHLLMSQSIINNYRNKENDKVMNKVIKDTEKEVYQIYDDAVQEEKRWATYLFQKGSMIGLSEKLLHQYVEYIANRRMRTIGLNQVYEHSSSNNPLPWTQHWFNSRSMQNAPQETEIESYVIGGLKQDVKKDQFKTFKL